MFLLSDENRDNFFTASASKAVFLELIGLGPNVNISKTANIVFLQEIVAKMRRTHVGTLTLAAGRVFSF
jgi:hypothetical protein